MRMQRTGVMRVRLTAVLVSIAAGVVSFCVTPVRGGYIVTQMVFLAPSVTLGGRPQTATGGQVVGVSGNHAQLWNTSGQVDLNPTLLNGISSSYALGTDGNQQVGYGFGSSPTITQALLWSGSPGSATNLNPAALGITSSEALGLGGGQLVGDGSGSATGGNSHALLWKGPDHTAVDLHPTNLTGVSSSVALATNGSRQVGLGVLRSPHAMLWSGAPDTVIDLNPTHLAGIDSSYAYGISPDGTQQVGVGNGSGGPLHALLWNGTADAAVDLNPLSGFVSSEAFGTNGIQQVGDGLFKLSDECNCTRHHALIWTGTADSVFDLHALLPAGCSESEAYSIDAEGNVYGVAKDPTIGEYAVEWSPTPEPTSLSLFGMGALAWLSRRPRYRR